MAALLLLAVATGERGLPVVMPVFAPGPAECRDLVDQWAQEGVTCFMIGSDKILIANTFGQWIGGLADRAT